jgi:tight adherence protein B
VTPTVPALLLAAAVLLASLPGPGRARLRALRAPASGGRPAAPPYLPLAVAALAFTRPGLAALALLGLAAARPLAAARARTRDAAAVTAALPELCRATAAELRTGAPPSLALARAAADAPPPLAAHLRRLTHDVAPAPPAEWAALPGAEPLRALGALWSVAADAGHGLADGLDRLAASLAAEQRRRADVAAQLAGPRASAAVLAALPLCGLALAGSLGARPVPFLLGTPYGLACLVAGLALDAAGVWWVRRITRAATAA